jgi:plastocyanin
MWMDWTGGDVRRLLIAGALATAVVTACGSASTPSAGSSSASTPAAPTLVPGAVTAPPAGAGPVDLTAVNIDFEPKVLVASAGTVVISFHNQDDGIPHNVEVKDANGASVYQGAINSGPNDSEETIGDLLPGAYTFTCTIHPTMQGTLTVLP